MENINLSGKVLREIEESYDQNNANQVKSGSTILQAQLEYLQKKIGEQIIKEDLPEVYKKFKSGYYHLNDFAFFNLKPSNCFTLNALNIFETGLVTNGDKTTGVVSKPAKYLTVALNHLIEAEIMASNEMSGGINIPFFNWAIAPYWANASETERRQSIQNYIYRLNQICSSRGAQTLFSSVNLNLECPEFLKEQKIPKILQNERKYIGEYQEEADEIIKYICRIMNDGDARGAPMLFPNLVFNITNADLTKFPEIFELTVHYWLPYFTVDRDNKYSVTMGCRTRNEATFTGDPELDCLNVGNAVYTCLNLPFIALKSQESNKSFEELIEECMEDLYDYTLLRLEIIKERLNNEMMNFLKQFYTIENMSLAIGMVGLNEASEILFDLPIEDCVEENEKILQFMTDKINEFKKRDGLRWGLFSNPSENSAGKLAEKTIKEFGVKKANIRGTTEAPYYSNGVNLDSGKEIDLLKRIKIEGRLSQYTPFGNIVAINTGESWSDPLALMSLTEKIRDNSKAFFFAYSGAYSICDDCNHKINNVIEECPLCNGTTTTYDRVTGYVRPLKTWSKNKVEEESRRYRY